MKSLLIFCRSTHVVTRCYRQSGESASFSDSISTYPLQLYVPFQLYNSHLSPTPFAPLLCFLVKAESRHLMLSSPKIEWRNRTRPSRLMMWTFWLSWGSLGTAFSKDKLNVLWNVKEKCLIIQKRKKIDLTPNDCLTDTDSQTKWK